jgi:hypothetical protein
MKDPPPAKGEVGFSPEGVDPAAWIFIHETKIQLANPIRPSGIVVDPPFPFAGEGSTEKSEVTLKDQRFDKQFTNHSL